MRRVLNKEEVMVYESFVPRKRDMNGNQVRLLCCGFLPTSSPRVGVFLGFLGRFVSNLASVSLCDVALNPRILVFEFVRIQHSISLCDISCHFFSSLSSLQDMMHCRLSLSMGLCTLCQKSKLQQYTRFFFVGS